MVVPGGTEPEVGANATRVREGGNPFAYIVALGALLLATLGNPAAAMSLDVDKTATLRPFQLATGTALDRVVKQVEAAVAQAAGRRGNNAAITRLAERNQLGTLGLTIRFRNLVHGVPVFGVNDFVHVDREGLVRQINLAELSTPPSLAPQITAVEAFGVLRAETQGELELLSPAKLVFFPVRPTPESAERVLRLAYRLQTLDSLTGNRRDGFVEALTGQVLLNVEHGYELEAEATSAPLRTVYYANTKAAREQLVQAPLSSSGFWPGVIDFKSYIKILEDGKSFERPGAPAASIEGKRGRPLVVDESARNAYENMGRVYEYFRRAHGWTSFDNANSRIVSVVHAGVGMASAKWDEASNSIVYGDGDGKHIGDLTRATDITGHEFTHAVILRTSKLIPSNESGALAESFGDFFGRLVDLESSPTDAEWRFGSRVVLPAFGKPALRDLAEPESLGQPAHVASTLRIANGTSCDSSNDRCGIHRNSGIPSFVATRIARELGREKTARLWFAVMTQGLSPLSDFRDARRAAETHCQLLFGDAGTSKAFECKIVAEAFEAAGIRL